MARWPGGAPQHVSRRRVSRARRRKGLPPKHTLAPRGAFYSDNAHTGAFNAVATAVARVRGSNRDWWLQRSHRDFM